MKTFNDLEFKNHPDGLRATIKFGNNYGVSVIRLKSPSGRYSCRYMSYTSNENEWELAVIYWDGDSFDLTYNTPITNDVLGHLTAEEVTEVMLKVQAL